MTVQISQVPRRTPLGGTGFLLIVSGATILMVALISAFLALGNWALLPAIMLALLLVTGGVIGAIGRLLGQEDAPEPAAISKSA